MLITRIIQEIENSNVQLDEEISQKIQDLQVFSISSFNDSHNIFQFS